MAYTSSMPNPSSQSGGIFTYILIGIALFAALGYAISRNSIRTDFVSDEKARLIASEIINFHQQMGDAAAKLRLRGCKDTQFDFSNSVYKTTGNAAINGGNTLSPSDDSCDLFSAAGGGLTPYIPPSEALDSNVIGGGPQSGHGTFAVFQMKGVGSDGVAGTTSANDIVFGIAYLKQGVCSKINEMLGVTTANATPPAPSITGTSPLYVNGDLTATGIETSTVTNYKRFYCYSFSAGKYSTHYALVPR